ncbi:hypothetical protein ACE193_24750 [Bernardetia sp. OM2101]|uniref:hypothetical protein n=1 Tax=Bernardetia sp. OM2101 TaxID=3344876 RepID=UPI0035D06427
MFTQKNTKPFSKWLKLLFTLTLCIAFFASCDDDNELTPEQIEEQRKNEIVGTWDFASSTITTPLAPEEDSDYRDIKTTLGAVGQVNASELELNADGTYKFTNGIIGGGMYIITGNWEFRSDDEFQADFIQLKGFYKQLLNRLDADTDFFNDVFAESFENFQIISRTENEIQLSNEGIIVEESTTNAPPRNISVEGKYTITRK